MTMFDSDSLELFLHDHIVPLWEKSGWMTAKYIFRENKTQSILLFFFIRKIISEVIRIEYRPLHDPNPSQSQSSQVKVFPIDKYLKFFFV